MMDKGIILRYGELHLKGKNRGFFEKKLLDDIKYKLFGTGAKVICQRGRYLVTGFDEGLTGEIVARCKRVFGLHSLSIVEVVRSEVSEICAACERVVSSHLGCEVSVSTNSDGIAGVDSLNNESNHENESENHGVNREHSGSGDDSGCRDGHNYKDGRHAGKTFRVSANRADKSFPLNSIALSARAGGHVLSRFARLEVDLHNPDFTVSIDVREEGHAFVFCGSEPCAGGMPLGSSGRGLLLLSGGLDSPVAGYMMMRRGLLLDALHFHSYPYTNEQAQKKVEDLAARLASYCGSVRLHMVKLTEVQEKIKQYCDERFSVIVLRMIMMKTSEIVAKKMNCGCLVNGESLGQVASQTLESLIITDSVVNMPVFRPLIGTDKQEIIEIARKIDTYDTAILPFEDCCTVFLPKHPITRPTPDAAAKEYAKLPDLEEMLLRAVAEMETKIVK